MIMKEIKLTQGKIALVDDEDYERLNRYKWYARMNGHTWYAMRSICINGKQTTILMHREIMNAPEGVQVDHIDSNGLDNRKEILRLCTNQENGFNRDAQKNNKLGIKGVRWDKRRNKFYARIKLNGKEIHLGSFNVMGDADSAYRIAEEKYFGEFARHN